LKAGPIFWLNLGALLLSACGMAGGRSGNTSGEMPSITLTEWAEKACGPATESSLGGLGSPLDRCYVPGVTAHAKGIHEGLRSLQENTKRAHNRFKVKMKFWEKSENRFSDDVLFAIKCLPNQDYVAGNYVATDMVIDCLRDQSCTKNPYAKKLEPDDIVPLRQGGKGECGKRNPWSRQADLVKAVKNGVEWRLDNFQSAITRQPVTENYLVEAEIAKAINRHFQITPNSGLLAWRNRERYEAVDSIASLKRHLQLLAPGDFSGERPEAACRLKKALRKQHLTQFQEAFQMLWGRQLLNLAAIKKAASESCVNSG